MPKTRDIHGGDVWAAARGLGVETGRVIDFSASINPLGMPSGARKAARDSLGLAPHYPEPSAATVVEAFEAAHSLEPGSALAGNGSAELIYQAARALVPEKALIIEPAFSEYARALSSTGCRVERFTAGRKHSFVPDTERLVHRIAKGYDVLFIANPANPTGALVPRRDLVRVIEACRSTGCVCVVDEAFVDFVEEESVKGLAARYPNLLVLRSMTKFYAMAGLRLGFAVAAPRGRLMAHLRRSTVPWTVNTPALMAGAESLRDGTYRARTIKWLAPAREKLARGLAGAGPVEVFPSAANFLMCRITGGRLSATDLRDALLARGLLVRDLSAFRGLGPDYFRVAVRSTKENALLVESVGEVFSENR